MIRGTVGAAIAGLVVLIAILGSWYTVDQTERGVLLRNGAVIGTAQRLRRPGTPGRRRPSKPSLKT